MKKIIIAICFLFLTVISFSQSRKIKKNFELIKTGDLTEVFHNLNEIKKKESVSPYPYYLLALYFGDDRNSMKNIDSCFVNFRLSVKLAKSIVDEKELNNACVEIHFCLNNLKFQLDSISNVAFEIYSLENNISTLKKFINLYTETSGESKAKNLLDKLLFIEAKESKSTTIIEKFITEFPSSYYLDSAKNEIENIIYKEALNNNNIEEYNNFIKRFPNSNFKTDIELKRDLKIFELIILKKSESDYNDFITNYPTSTLKNDAIKNRNFIVYEDAKNRNDLQTYKDVLIKYPDIEFANEIKDSIIKLEQNIVDTNFVDEITSNNQLSSTDPTENKSGSSIASGSGKAQDDGKSVSITVSGSGKSLEDAKQAALRSSIEQAFGAFISSKTEMFNDQVVADQMASVSSGNIKSYEVLNESQLPDGSWGVTLKALVSVDKLTSFVEAKGVAIEIKGGLFALNVKQQILNEQAEIQAVAEMVGLLHEPMQIAFDYAIKSGEPKSLDAESKNWEIPLTVTATCNKNMDFCANYFIKTLLSLSLTSAELESYKSLNKQVFPITVKYISKTTTLYLRKETSINAVKSLLSNWEFYTKLFAVNSGMDEFFGVGKGSPYNLTRKDDEDVYEDESDNSNTSISFPAAGNIAATFVWNDTRTLSQIEQITGYVVKPRGVVLQFKHGGYVLNEENGHGIVVSMIPIHTGDEHAWVGKYQGQIEELLRNGYSDWRLPTPEESEALKKYLEPIGINLIYLDFWSYYGENYRITMRLNYPIRNF